MVATSLLRKSWPRKSSTIRTLEGLGFKAKRFVAKSWFNPYTEKEKVNEEKDRIKRKNLFSYDKIWNGNENRPGEMDLREELLILKGPTCNKCRETFHPSELQMDHIIVRAKFKDPKDADKLENQQLLCTKCHRAKTKIDLKVLLCREKRQMRM